jgi:Uma2 family endonuclease
MSAVLRLATYADVLAAPADKTAELIRGALSLMPRPSPRHGYAMGEIKSSLSAPFQFGRGNGPGGWLILVEPELHLDGDVLVPDLAAWRRERLNTVPETAHISVVPDWVCEILSPRTAQLDRTVKRPRYAELGVAHLWMVDPAEETLEVFALDGRSWRLAGAYAGDDPIHPAPFDALPFPLGDLWARNF